MKSVVTMLLTRLQTAWTDAYVYDLVYFLRIQHGNSRGRHRPGFLVQLSGGGTASLLANVVLPQILKMLPNDRKVVIVGVTRKLTQSSLMVLEPSVKQCATTHLKSVQHTVVENPDEALYALDFEEQGAWYQAAETMRAIYRYLHKPSSRSSSSRSARKLFGWN